MRKGAILLWTLLLWAGTATAQPEVVPAEPDPGSSDPGEAGGDAEATPEEPPAPGTTVQVIPPPAPPSPLPGRTASESTPEAMEEARLHMQRGELLYGEGRFVDAAQEFVAAYLTVPSSAFLFNAGLAYLEANEWRPAVDYLRRYIEAEPNAPDRPMVESRIQEIEAVLPSLPPDGSTEQPPPAAMILITREEGDSRNEMKSLISVETVPIGALVVLLDTGGQPIAEGIAPVRQTLSLGAYSLRVEHPDYRTVTMPVVINPGEVHIFHIEMSQGEFLGFLQVASSVVGAQVFVDDMEHGPVGDTPWGDVVPVGDHTVWVSLPGYEPMERLVTVEMGETTEAVFELERVPYGEIEVLTNVPGAALAIDGLPVGTARPGEGEHAGLGRYLENYPAGAHVLTVTAEDMKPYTEEVMVGEGQRTRVLVRLNPEPSRTGAWVSFGVAGALFIAGGVFGGVALDIHDGIQVDRNNGRLDNNDPRILEDTLWSAGADAAFVLGAAMTGLGIYYLLRDPLPDSEARTQDPVDFADIDGWTPPEETSVEVSPAVGPGTVGFGLEVRF